MASGHEEHAHEHKFVEILDSETITVFEQVPHGVITLQLQERGVSLELGYDEATALATLMEMGVKQRKPEEQALRCT